jgi:hypothetical protein
MWNYYHFTIRNGSYQFLNNNNNNNTNDNDDDDTFICTRTLQVKEEMKNISKHTIN